jgi:hypothetical protein
MNCSAITAGDEGKIPNISASIFIKALAPDIAVE